MVQRSTKFTGICIGIYVCYALFVFLLLPLLVPDPVTMQRALLAFQTRHIGNLSNFTLETGGTPQRSLLLTFKGSGAFDLLDNMSQQLGCYHHFAPLIAYQRRIEDEQLALQALSELVQLFKCDYNQSTAMLRWGMRTPIFRRFYGQQAKLSMSYPMQTCWDPAMLTKLCKIYPFINMSVYNLGLKYLAMLLDRADLNVRMVLLVRDPRGTFHSRAHRILCANNDCGDAREVCSELVSDYRIAEKLVKQHPTRFRIMRYEDLEVEPWESIRDIFDFYGLPTESHLGELLRPVQGYRDIYGSPFDWLQEMPPIQIKAVQDACGEALELWGYRKIKNIMNFTQVVAKFESVLQPPPFAV